MHLITELKKSYLRSFVESRRPVETKKGYERALKFTQGDPDKFLDLAGKDRRKAEDSLIAFVVKRRASLSDPRSSWLSITSTFVEYFKVQLNWRRKARWPSFAVGPWVRTLRRGLPQSF